MTTERPPVAPAPPKPGPPKPAPLKPGLLALLPGAVLAVWSLAALAMGLALLDAPDRAHALGLLESRAAVIAFAACVFAGLLGWAAVRAHERWVLGPARAAEQALVTQRQALQAELDSRVHAASHDVALERSRLAALMAELTHSVVVCALDGRVLLYNTRARAQFRALSPMPTMADGAELIGLGRSIHTVLDPALVAHALDGVRERLARGEPQPSAQFVTGTRNGRLLHVQLAPVREVGADGSPGGALSGFVLMLDDVTRDMADASDRDALLHELTEGSRAALGTLQAAVELLDGEGLDAPTRARLQAVVRDEVHAMGQRLRDTAARSAQALKARWPLQDMQGADLVDAARRRIEADTGCRTAAGVADPALWLRVDSYALLLALSTLAARLVEHHGVNLLQLRLGTHGERAQLDLVWTGAPLNTETVMAWETEPMRGGSPFGALTVRDVVERHGGAFWFERERVRHDAFFRFLLPLAAGDAVAAAPALRHESRPVSCDFDLFRASPATESLGDQSLDSLSYTVFDTETTGLDPSGGDEIVQIGAVRIVSARLQRHERFDQLVDPQRPIAPAATAVHGITREQVAGQPTIDAVLPVFRAFVGDSVLVAHNAAFDLRFLELKEARTGLRFDQPVLDTMLLSAVVHPSQASHGLESIAQRLGVPMQGRHTALGDALVTAEVFLGLLPLLQAMGIHTLAQARAASQRTWQARLAY